MTEEDLTMPAPTDSEALGLVVLHKLLVEDKTLPLRLAAVPTIPCLDAFLYVLKLADLCYRKKLTEGTAEAMSEAETKQLMKLTHMIDQAGARIREDAEDGK